jgi:peptidylprolyl isomerase
MMRFALSLLAAFALSTTMALADNPPDPTEWRTLDPDNTLYIDTTMGRIVIEMYPEIAPEHVARVRTLAGRGFYDGLSFHRVIDGFMAQGGDPRGTGEGGSDLPDLPPEFLFRRGPDMPFVEAGVMRDNQGRIAQRSGFYKMLPIETQPDDLMARSLDGRATAWGMHCPGVVSMARFAEPDSANSQFFIMRAAYPALDKRYSIWGRVVWGLDAVQAFPVGEPPSPTPVMTRVRVGSSLAESERTRLLVLRTDSPAFRDLVEDTRRRVRREPERIFSLCDVEIPVLAPDEPQSQERERPWWRRVIP